MDYGFILGYGLMLYVQPMPGSSLHRVSVYTGEWHCGSCFTCLWYIPIKIITL